VPAGAAVEDGPHHAPRLRPLGEQVAHEHEPRSREPSVDELDEPLELRAAAVQVTDGDRR
jgi:hypothetical protein